MAASQGAAITVCLDRNADLACGSGEPAVAADATGAFLLSVDGSIALAGLNLVALLPATAAAGTTPAQPAYAMASRAQDGTVVSALTTLEAMHATTPANWMGLGAAVHVHEAGNAGALQINRAIQPALAQAVGRLTTRSANPLAVQPATALAAQAVEQVLAGYIDPAAGTLLHTVSARTVQAEALYKVSPSACAVAPPASPMLIKTALSAPILDKETYVPATVQIDGGTVLTTGIRGRGNSTWEMPKKPYRLKLDTKASLMGMDTNKDWVLLANYSDKSLMRNSVANCLSQMLGFVYTPPSRYVELTLNNDYVGVYQLTDQIENEDARVSIGKLSTAIADPGMPFLLEIDARLDEDYWFNSQLAVPYTVKSDLVDGQLPNIQAFIGNMETAMSSAGFKAPGTGYDKYLETDTLVDYYLLNQYIRNHDAFWSSTFTWRQRDGKLNFGPVWDHDISFGNIDYDNSAATSGWETKNQSPYITRLMQDPQFARHLAVRWKYLSSRLAEIPTFIDATAQVLQAPQTRNFARWPILNTYVWPNAKVTGSYAGEVAYLKSWLAARGTWINGQLVVTP